MVDACRSLFWRAANGSGTGVSDKNETGVNIEIIAFLESTGFEDALRNAVSLGGDSDTLACITGGIAEAFYGMPPELQQETLKRLPEEMRAAYEPFRQSLERRM